MWLATPIVLMRESVRVKQKKKTEVLPRDYLRAVVVAAFPDFLSWLRLPFGRD